jgi:hypothetical protein
VQLCGALGGLPVCPPKIRCTALSRAALGQPSRPKSRRNGVNRGLRCAVAYALSVFQTFPGKDSIKLFEGAKSGSSRASDHCHSGLGRQAVGMWPWHEWSLCLSVLAIMTYLRQIVYPRRSGSRILRTLCGNRSPYLAQSIW